MPKVRFAILDDQGLIPDEEGVELSGSAAACREGEDGARAIPAEAIRQDRGTDDRKIEIVSENGVVIATLNLWDVLGA